MRWILNEDDKPELYKVVVLRYQGCTGRIVEREGFWTGYAWRVIGEKYRVPFAVTEWSYLPAESCLSSET